MDLLFLPAVLLPAPSLLDILNILFTIMVSLTKESIWQKKKADSDYHGIQWFYYEHPKAASLVGLWDGILKTQSQPQVDDNTQQAECTVFQAQYMH